LKQKFYLKTFIDILNSAGTLINLASPREHFEMIDSINPMDPNVTVVDNLLGAAQGK
jgi:hypothetical protein